MGYDSLVPKKPETVVTMVRLTKAEHQQVKIRAIKEGLTLQALVSKALTEYMKK